MNNIKMVVTDLDGTLLKSNKLISDYTSNIISKLHEKGILFIVATARPVRAVKNFLPWINYDPEYFKMVQRYGMNLKESVVLVLKIRFSLFLRF